MLYFTGSALNVQSLLGIIFIVGIKVANTVLMTDYAQELRRHEGLTPLEAIRKAARLRVRPMTMTALAAFFAMIPAALAIERGSEANAPLARAILGGLLAGEPATLFVVPALYAMDDPRQKGQTQRTRRCRNRARRERGGRPRAAGRALKNSFQRAFCSRPDSEHTMFGQGYQQRQLFVSGADDTVVRH